MKKEIVEKILTETETGYDAIAHKFSQTRKHFWRSLEAIKDYTRDGDNILDFGCGNGRLYELFADKQINYFGVDVSGKLIKIAKDKYGQDQDSCHPQLDWGSSLAQQSKKGLDSHFHGNDNAVQFQKINPNQITLAFADGFFNTCYSIAVFHHFPSREYRKVMAGELYRVTKSGGFVVVTAWYLWQRKYLKNIWQNWKNKFFGKSQLDWNDCQISFTDNAGTRIERFHHAFTKRELRKLFEDAGFEIEKCEIVDGSNILLVGKKG